MMMPLPPFVNTPPSVYLFGRISRRSAADWVNAAGVVFSHPYPVAVDTCQAHRAVKRPCASAAPDGCCYDRSERNVSNLAADELDVYVALFYLVIVHRAACHLVEPFPLGLRLPCDVAQDDIIGQHAAQLHRRVCRTHQLLTVHQTGSGGDCPSTDNLLYLIAKRLHPLAHL